MCSKTSEGKRRTPYAVTADARRSKLTDSPRRGTDWPSPRWHARRGIPSSAVAPAEAGDQNVQATVWNCTTVGIFSLSIQSAKLRDPLGAR